MIDFFTRGGVPGMVVIAITGLGALIWAIFSLIKYLKDGIIPKRYLDAILFLGSLSFFSGILWQSIGSTAVLSAIQEYPEVSRVAIAAGMRVSMIGTIFGASLFVFSGIFWFILRYLNAKKQEA